ncbi:patatin-like phospholipase family protein [Candidatus Latescibacterota bacterium]
MKTLIAFLCSTIITLSVGAETFSITYENGHIVRRYPEGSHPVIGLALSGGGARGLAHIGIIEILEKAGIRIERIAGTSMGSIVGGLYAAGYSTAALTELTESFNWSEAFSNIPRRRSIYIGEKETRRWPLFELRFDSFKAQIPSSLSAGQRISSFLSWLTLRSTYECGKDFDKLPIQFRSITTDINTGRKIVLGNGSLGRAIQASSTIPLLLSPVERGNMLLVDGGLTDNLPIDEVRKMGSDFVIAVAIEESMHPPKELDNPLNVADQITSIPMRNVTRLSKRNADFVISPNMEAFSSKDFSNIPGMIDQGRKDALSVLPALLDSLARKTLRGRKTMIHTITFSPLYDEDFIHSIVNRYIKIGELNLFADITHVLDDLWSTGNYCRIFADLDEKTGALEIELTKIPRSVIVQLSGKNNNTPVNQRFGLSAEGDENLSMKTIIGRVDSLLRVLRSEGFSFAHITDSTLDESLNSLIITAQVPHLTHVLFDKGLTSRHSLIMREFEIDVGETFNLNKVMLTIDNLYGTNLFEWIYADVEPYNGGVGLRIHLSEKDWTVARFGLRFDETFNTEGRMTLTRENILGFGNQLTATAHLGQRTKLLMLENKNDRIYKSLYTFNLKTYRHYWKRFVYADPSDYVEYEDDRYGTVFSVGQQMDKLGNAMLQFKSETIWIRFAPAAKIKNAQKEIRSIVFRSLIDSYDQYPFPGNGYMNIIYVESASEVMGGSEQFAKIVWSSSLVRTYARKHTVGGSFMVGTADPSIPDIEAFSMGGDTSHLNCYDSDSGGSHFYADFYGMANEEKRGTRIAVGKLSYRLFVPRAFYLEFLYSIGNVWGRGVTITADTLLQSYGIKASFSTYAGPLSIGWGITSEGNDRIYMSSGWEF